MFNLCTLHTLKHANTPLHTHTTHIHHKAHDYTRAQNTQDLGVFATLMSFEPRCVCGKDMLESIHNRLRSAWRDSVYALAALTLAAIAGV